MVPFIVFACAESFSAMEAVSSETVPRISGIHGPRLVESARALVIPRTQLISDVALIAVLRIQRSEELLTTYRFLDE
ncbi:MAG: hypothetical protein ACLFPO_13390, partial [Spirochaetaceae bacterium]